MKIVKLTRENFEEILLTSSQLLKKGNVIVYPTDTLYALGADTSNKKAVKKVFDLKKRDYNKPIPLIASSVNMVKKIGYWNKVAEKLANVFWPGPLTLIFSKKAKNIFNGSEVEISARIPTNEFARRLSEKIGNPITATSVNISGGKPIERVEELMFEVDLVIDVGTLRGKPSTVFDTRNLQIIREGCIPKEKILSVIE